MSAFLSDYHHAWQNRTPAARTKKKNGTPSGLTLAAPEVHLLNETAFIFPALIAAPRHLDARLAY